MQEYLKHLLIRTPLQEPAKKLQFLLESKKRNQHPELNEIYVEGQRTEQMLRQVIKDSFNCIDIGCHLGSVLSEIVKIAPNQQHIAFEPIPYKAEWLKDKFPEVEVKQMALSDTPGQVTFYINPNFSGFSGLQPHQAQKDANLKEITVKCETLDNILVPDRPVNFIKIDVEGAELPALRGAQNTLSRYQPTILFECTKAGVSGFGYEPVDLFNFLTKDFSYSIFLLKDFLNNDQPLEFERFFQAMHYPFQAFNFLAIKR